MKGWTKPAKDAIYADSSPFCNVEKVVNPSIQAPSGNRTPRAWESQTGS